MIPSNLHCVGMVWGIFEALPVDRRFKLYKAWEDAFETSFPLRFWVLRAKQAAKAIFKRVVSKAQAEDTFAHQAHFHLAKICYSSPIAVLEVLLSGLESGFNTNLINPYVQTTRLLPPLCVDVMGYLFLRNLSKAKKDKSGFNTNLINPYVQTTRLL